MNKALWKHGLQGLLPLIDYDGDGKVSAQDFLTTFDLDTGGDISVMELLNGVKHLQKRAKRLDDEARVFLSVFPRVFPRAIPCIFPRGTHEVTMPFVMKRV